MKKPLWLVVWLLVIEVLVILLLIPGDWTDTAIQKEAVLVENNLGPEAQEWIDVKASDWYQSSILDSGFYEATHQFLIPSQEEKDSSKGMESMGSSWFVWVEGRLDAMTNMIYQFYTRIALLMSWAPYLLILLVPAIYDGLMTWRIKRTNFAYASPVLHRYSLRATVILGFGLFITFFAPIPLNPIIIPAVMMCCCVLFGIAFGNLQKRV